MDLDKNQEILQKEAKGVLEKLDLTTLLFKCGEVNFVGSFEPGLMTRRDIDAEIIVKSIDREVIKKLINNLIDLNLRRIDFAVIENRDGKNKKNPIGIYVGLKYYGENIPIKEMLSKNPNAWQIDLHFVLKKDSRSKEKTNTLKEKLNPEKKRIILEIKSYLTNSNPNYRKTFTALDVYNAVLDENIKNLTEFKEYLRRIGKEY